MPKPMAICIEDLDAQPGEARYLRCVAVPGRQPGLRVDAGARVLWQSEADVAGEIWVSADERLILYRPAGAAAVTLRRVGRSLDVPEGKPVVMVDQDQVDVGPRRLRVHVHGEAPAVAPPVPVAGGAGALGRFARAAAAAVALSSAVAGGGCKAHETPPTGQPPHIDVREQPPAPPVAPPPPPIQVRETPPEVMAPEPGK